MHVQQVYRKLYEDGVVIVEDFFDDERTAQQQDPNYPEPLFTCSETQQTFIAKRGIGRDTVFDGVKRSTTTLGYDTVRSMEKAKGSQTSKAFTGPGRRQQLKPCKVTRTVQVYPPYVVYISVLSVKTAHDLSCPCTSGECRRDGEVRLSNASHFGKCL